MRLLGIMILTSCFIACSEEGAQNETLSSFINTSNLTVQDSSVIACAAGGMDSINVYYYPELGFSDFRLWQLTSPTTNPDDFVNYVEVQYPISELFNGYLEFFILDDLETETWVTVTGRSDKELVVAQPIRLKQQSLFTEINPDVLTIDQSEVLSPRFSWEDGSNPGTAIYFHVISDENGDLLSGTYTFDRNWQFYDLSNVVLNIREISPPPALVANKTYTFSLMGVSQDNWVNMLVETTFSTN